MMQVTKVWWDGERLMAEPIDPAAIYKDVEQPKQAKPVAVEFPRQAPQKEGGWRLDTSFIWRVLHTIAPDEPAEFIPSPEQIENTLLALEKIPSNLYTAILPHQTWVGLDQHDIDVLFLSEDGVRFARYIEAKLKEKNI
jgi:hypothetical protein